MIGIEAVVAGVIPAAVACTCRLPEESILIPVKVTVPPAVVFVVVPANAPAGKTEREIE